MPLPGGASDKFGNRYEQWWTVSEMVQMLYGDAESIRIEDPGVSKAEFVVVKNGRNQLHQAKRSHPDGKWSLAELAAKDTRVLQAMHVELIGNDAEFVFVSSSDARELAELSDRSRQAEDLTEFQKYFVTSKQQKTNLEKLTKYWDDADISTVYDVLKRIHVRTIDEQTIEQHVQWGLRALFLADPAAVSTELWKIADDCIHQTLTRQDLVNRVERRGFRLRRLVRTASAPALIAEVTNRYLSTARSRLIRRSMIPRPATRELLKQIAEHDSCDAVLTGSAGAGKTACVVELVDELRDRSIPAVVLAFRVDRLKPVSNTAELGEQLGLEESPTLVLAAAATGGEAVMIIDQLDAISSASGRNSDFFEVVESLLEEARGLRGKVKLHIVVVCRAFDLDNDHRLRRLTEKHAKVTVGSLSENEVNAILTAEGFRPQVLHPTQLQLLLLPQNLAMFLGAGFDPATSPAFKSAKELFDRYWDEKRRAVAARAAPEKDEWVAVIQLLVEEMTRTQQLSVPREKLDSFSPDYLAQMGSEGVLTLDGGRYGLGHESFFDYCFARDFVAKEESLVAFLKKSEQHLFRRAQVRQVLAYLRDGDRKRYHSELSQLLRDDGIRVHIKDLALALLFSVAEPGADEWAIVEGWIESEVTSIAKGERNPDKFARLVWKRFFTSEVWFNTADQRGLIASWMASDNLANTATDYLRIHQRHSGDRVAELLTPYVGRSLEWDNRCKHIMQWADLEKSRALFDLFLQLIDNGVLDDARGPIAVNSTFWSMLYSLAQERPEWIPEVMARWVRRRMTIVAGEKKPDGKADWNNVFSHDQFAGPHFHESASRAPQVFVRHVLPVVLDLSDAAVYGEGGSLPHLDQVWPIIFATEYEMPDAACLNSLLTALEAISTAAENVRDLTPQLMSRQTYIANLLLLSVYRAGASFLADDAAATLVKEPWRFRCGFSDSPYWTSMELVKAIVPLCSAENRARLEAAILAFSSDYERTPEGYKSVGRSAFALLSAFPTEYRSATATTRFRELERKFREPDAPPTGIRGGVVGPPIKREAAEKMTDEQWLSAIEKYDSEHSHDPHDFLKGGAWELAGIFREFVRNEPERFAKLALTLPPTVNPAYLDRALDGLKDAAAPFELKLNICRKAYAEHRVECGKSISDLLGRMEQTLPPDAIAMLIWLATEHPDPEKELWNETATGKTPYYGGDILTHGINTTRGRAAEAIRDLILADSGYVALFRPALRRLAQDKSVAVRSCAASTALAVSTTDWPLAFTLFSAMVEPSSKWIARLFQIRRRIPQVIGLRHFCGRFDGFAAKHLVDDDRLFRTAYIDRFIRFGLHNHARQMVPFIQRMLRSEDALVRESGARLSSLGAISNEHRNLYQLLVDQAVQGDASQRLGVARVASKNIGHEPSRSWCEKHLLPLFDDEDAEVRREAASCFRELKDRSFEQYSELIDSFCESRAYETNSASILFALDESPERLPGITTVVCEKFVSRFSDEANDIRTSRAGDVHLVAKLLFRTYHQHEKDEWAHRCLDLIDSMCLEGIQGVSKGLADFER
jgi:hypothetical protein